MAQSQPQRLTEDELRTIAAEAVKYLNASNSAKKGSKEEIDQRDAYRKLEQRLIEHFEADPKLIEKSIDQSKGYHSFVEGSSDSEIQKKKELVGQIQKTMLFGTARIRGMQFLVSQSGISSEALTYIEETEKAAFLSINKEVNDLVRQLMTPMGKEATSE